MSAVSKLWSLTLICAEKRVSTPLVHGDDESVEEDEVMLIEDEEIENMEPVQKKRRTSRGN